jgi:hypothetical protein
MFFLCREAAEFIEDIREAWQRETERSADTFQVHFRSIQRILRDLE